MTKKAFTYFFSLLTVLLLSSIVLPLRSVAAPEFVIGSASNVATSTVTIPVTNKFAQQMLALQGSINWDNSKLTYQVAGTSLAQLSGIQFNPSVSSNTGRLSFLWVDNSLAAQNFPENTVLFTITFNVVSGATGVANIIFANTPTQLLVSDAAGNAVNNMVYTNGTVTFPGTPLAPEFRIGSASNVATSTVTVPVTTKNFLQLLAWQGSVNWNNSKITYNGISNIISQLSGISFNPSVNGSTGRLSFLWSDANLLPQTIADNSVLFNITFNVVGGATGSTDVDFTNTPTNLLLSNAGGTAVNTVSYFKGTISFPGATLAPEFILGSAFNVGGSTVSIPVTCKNFTQLLSMQGSINWNNTKLTFNSISSPVAQLSGLLSNATVNGSNGRLAFLWTDANLAQQTIPDNTVLFSILFNVVGTSGYTDLNFTNDPTNLLVSSTTTTGLSNVVYTPGKVTITPDFCYGGSTSLTSSITGVGYQWQVSIAGGAYTNLSDDATYTGSTSITLGLNNLTSTFSGYKYRCLVNGVYSNVFTLQFKNYWKGTVSNAWENPANWSCGVAPDANTDVVLDTLTPFNLVLSSNVTVKSVTVKAPSSLTITSGFNLTITGQ